MVAAGAALAGLATAPAEAEAAGTAMAPAASTPTAASNGDLEPYWRYHAAREHQRLYPNPGTSPDQQDYALAT
jgi:hypothetical protein